MTMASKHSFYALEMLDLNTDERRCMTMSGRVHRVKKQGNKWIMEVMQRGRCTWRIAGIQTEICEALTYGTLMNDASQWVQFSIDGLSTHVVRVPISEKVAYLEKKVHNDQGQLEALERIENWESVINNDTHVGGALICEPAEEHDGEVMYWNITRLTARDLLQPTELGQGFLAAFADRKPDGIAIGTTPIEGGRGLERRASKRKRDSEGGWADETEEDGNGVKTADGAPSTQGRRYKFGRSMPSGYTSGYGYTPFDSKLAEKMEPTVHAPPARVVAAAAAPGIGRVVDHLVDRFISSNDEDTFHKILQLCQALPHGC